MTLSGAAGHAGGVFLIIWSGENAIASRVARKRSAVFLLALPYNVTRTEKPPGEFSRMIWMPRMQATGERLRGTPFEAPHSSFQQFLDSPCRGLNRRDGIRRKNCRRTTL
jgi:hypothetical protein